MIAHHQLRRIAGTAAAAFAVCACLVFAPASSLALVGYPPITPSTVFGGPGSGNGQLSNPNGVAVDDSSGDVYVVDTGNNRVQEFDAEGKYLLQFNGAETPAGSFSGPYSIAVDNSSGPAQGDVYVADVGHGVIDVFDAAGKYLSQIAGAPSSFSGELDGVAVDASGNVWAYDSSGDVYEFSDTGGYLRQFYTGRGTERGFAVDSAGNVYLLFACGCIGKYTTTGQQLAEWGSGTALAVNEVTNDVFLDTSSGIEEFGALGEPYGSPLQAFAAGGISASNGIAVNDGTGLVYASESNADTVAVFKVALYPDVSTEAASGVQRTAVKLEGVVDPDGQKVTSCQFEYGTSIAYGQTAPCAPAPGSGSSPVAVSAQLSGLVPGAEYHYRLLAGNADGPNAGVDHTFTTSAAIPNLQTEAATRVELVGTTIVATLDGSLEPAGADTHYYFEYGETEAYGSVTPALPGTDVGEAFELEHAHAQLSGLTPYAIYHFRLVATNSFGTTTGADMSFNTNGLIPAPVVGGLPAANVSQFAATLNGTLQTGEALVNYHFEYGTSTAYGSIAPLPDAYTPITSESVSLAQPVSDLQAGTVYHYRLVASSPGGTEVKGPDETFTTLAIPVPTVETGAASEVGVGSATLAGTVDPQGWDTSYAFQYGTSTAYGSSWPTVLVDMGALEGPQPVLVSIPNLQPGTTYHYRLVASNGGGTSYGPDMTFTTGQYPPAIVQEPPTLRTLLVPSGSIAKPTASKRKAKPRAKRKRKPKSRKRRKGAKARHRT
jgi:DNA-binding beta-propeller fold protein YncE